MNIAFSLLYINSISYVIAALLIYFVCLCIMSKTNTMQSYLYAFMATAASNIFSSFIWIIAWASLAFLQPSWLATAFPSLFALLGTSGEHTILGSITINNILFLLAYWILFSVINTLLTVWISIVLFPLISKKRIIFWTSMANILSVGLGIILLGIYKYLYGSFPF